MKKASREKGTTERKAEPTGPLCFNCDAAMEKPDLFCGELCTQEASFVRYVRNVRQQDREKDEDIEYVIRVRMAHILNGGYPEKEREIPPAVRQQVIARANGICEAKECGKPGTDIDHIRGNSSDLTNLQYLCKECHAKKTAAVLKKLTPDHPRYDEFMVKITALRRRYTANKPLRPCDDHETWSKAWTVYKQERKLFFAQKSPRGDAGGEPPMLF
jgi:5-methylcytosine-specific restriction endonuclease McrA